jgi:hypothetical protein
MLVLAAGAGAEPRPAQHVDVSTPLKRQVSRLQTQSARALVRADYGRALALADAGLKLDPRNPWLHYDRGVALFGLRQVDDAVAELRYAEASFPPEDIWGRSIAIYQRAVKLQQIGRCADGVLAFREYAALVRRSAPDLADRAIEQAATGCPTARAPSYAARPLPVLPRVESAPPEDSE